MRIAVRFAIGLLSLIHALAPTEVTAAERVPVGINLSGVTYYASQHPFVDEFKQSQPWVFQKDGAPYGKGDPQPLRADGYPASLAPGQYVDSILGMDPDFPPGEYVLLYEGKGDVDVRGDAKTASRGDGRIEMVVRPKDHQLSVRITRTDPANPVRNIRFVPRDAESTYLEKPFREAFLKSWRGFGVLRFMDWQSTNNSPQRAWSDRTTPASQTQGGKRGVAVEHLVDLANTLETDPWFCLPHLASDDYVRRFATAVEQRLSPRRKVYVEYSNECWNGTFAQARYCADRGRELKLSDNAYQAQLRFYSQRSVEIFSIFEEVFGGKQRLVRVLASHHVNPWSSEQVLTWKDAHAHADALAVAPYFGHEFGRPDKVDATLALGVDGLLEACKPAIEKNKVLTAKQAELAGRFTLPLITYEGGAHMVGIRGAENNDKLTALFTEASRHPRMKDLYLLDLDNWRDAGGGLYVAFASTARPSKWGNWGVLESDGQDPKTAPKYQALEQFAGGEPGGNSGATPP